MSICQKYQDIELNTTHIEKMKRIIIPALLGLLCAFPSGAQSRTDTLRVSDLFTTHVIFTTDLIYADLSNSQAMAAKILDQSKNMMALKARESFSSPLSVSALESNGRMHTYIVKYDSHPASLVYDMRDRMDAVPSYADRERNLKSRRGGAAAGSQEGLYRRGDAPLLNDVVNASQSLWHISTRQYDIAVTCINILSYSDITYMVFTIDNGSGVSYECADATFVIESRKKTRKSVVYDRNLFPKSRYGTISCAPGSSTRIGYSLDKISLSKDQVLKVYFYEQGGQRELVLTVDSADINKAKTAL